MIGYVTVGTNDWKRALAFYDALMAELGAKRTRDRSLQGARGGDVFKIDAQTDQGLRNLGANAGEHHPCTEELYGTCGPN